VTCAAPGVLLALKSYVSGRVVLTGKAIEETVDLAYLCCAQHKPTRFSTGCSGTCRGGCRASARFMQERLTAMR
jgi:hypothetical protein